MSFLLLQPRLLALEFLVELFNVLEPRISFECKVINSLIHLFIAASEVLVVNFLLTLKLILSSFDYFKAGLRPILPVDVLLK